ncbi:ankyrin repeat domain-containing protein 27-like [Lytechinus variegatus]|uniref:ankyrin repeat domain-containing protein 27-like n=1 Tax=Lytechinus variegatus TaxID=7654 RepID=UPI001BB11802|nr:ankyrin repeat domain-containing protein 27-like [Lytechinus variegatus]
MRSLPNCSGTPTLLSKTAFREIVMDPTQNLMTALKSNSFSKIRSAIKMPCVDVNHCDVEDSCRTPLMKVCASSEPSATARRDLAKLLLAKNADVNVADNDGLTALAIACSCGDVGMVRLLAEDSSVDPNVADVDGNTPLMLACRAGHPEVVTALLTIFGRFGLKIDDTNNKGVTPLMEAARAGNTEICRALVQEGRADVNIRESTSYCTAFDFAIESGRCSTPELLLLSPVAQRKLNARQHRQAVGHKTLKEVIENSNLHCPRSERLKPTKLSVASKYEAYPLPTEYAQQANSMVFQVSKRLQRLSEDSEGELKEEAEMEEERKRAPIRRRYSLPSARHCVYGGGPNKVHRITPFHNQTASGSPRLARGKGTPSWLKLPPVPETTSLSRSPSPSEPIVEESSTTEKMPPASSSKSNVDSSKIRSESPTRSSTMKSIRVLPSNCSVQARRCPHDASIASMSSHKRPSLRISHSWEGRPSNTVPSYLFR